MNGKDVLVSEPESHRTTAVVVDEFISDTPVYRAVPTSAAFAVPIVWNTAEPYLVAAATGKDIVMPFAKEVVLPATTLTSTTTVLPICIYLATCVPLPTVTLPQLGDQDCHTQVDPVPDSTFSGVIAPLSC